MSPMYFQCPNHEHCGNFVEKPMNLCDDCQQTAKDLDRNVKQDAKLERQNWIHKNEGLRRHKRWTR